MSTTTTGAAAPAKPAAADASAGCCARDATIAIGNLRDDPVVIQAALDYVTVQHARIATLMDLPAPVYDSPLPQQYARKRTRVHRGGQG